LEANTGKVAKEGNGRKGTMKRECLGAKQAMVDRSDRRDGLEPTCRGGVISDEAGNVRKK
jgi:hypothetical protein